MFGDDTNLLYAEENIKTLFDTVNIELQKLSPWSLVSIHDKSKIQMFS